MSAYLSSLLNRFLLSTEQSITFMTNLEIQLGQERVGLAVALFFTFATLFGQLLRTSRRTGFATALAQGLIRSSWVFPLVYLPYIGMQMWSTLICTVFTTTGTWLLLRKAAREKPHPRRPRAVANHPNSTGNEVH